jgi:hypothetical protein
MRATIFKTFLPVIALVLSLGSSGEAKPDISGFGSISQKAIFTTAKYPALNLTALKKIYQKKCGLKMLNIEGCFLSERDVNPRGSANNVLLFRGENKLFSQPATSSYFRHYAKDKSLCPNGCDENILHRKLDEDLKGMQIDSKSYEMRADTYFHGPGVWSTVEDGKLKAAQYPFREVSVQHLQGRGLYFKADHTNFDPFVSFSTSPAIAQSFASEVILVASVPAKAVLLLTEDDCRMSAYEKSEFYMLALCTGNFAMTLEHEVSAMFYLPQQYLYSIIVKP